MKRNISLWIIIGIVIITAIIASAITAGITGNVIKAYSYSKPYGLQSVYTTAEVDTKIKEAIINNLKPSCRYVSRKDLSPKGESFEGKNFKEICNTWGLVPEMLVEGKDSGLYNHKDCSPSYQIINVYSNILYGNTAGFPNATLGATIENYCGNAQFPDGSLNGNFSNSKFRVWNGVLCCYKTD